jgi:hypothetical protein
MGAIGGPNVTPPTPTSTGGNDDFGGRPVDVVFKYAGANGNGDPGIIDPPTNALRMTNDLTILSGINSHPMRVAIVEYTAQMSGGVTLTDFTNLPEPTPAQPTGSYIMARHFTSLAADAIALGTTPVTYNGSNYYGSLILNPDLLGAIQQGGSISNVNSALAANSVNTAVDQALCFLTVSRSYYNTSNPNNVPSAPYLKKTYTGTPVAILKSLLADGYPVWSIDGQTDAYWNTAVDNLINGTGSTYSQVGVWFNACVANPAYDKATYQRPNFPAGFDGWVQANNWLIRTFSAHVTFGWQENMWAVSTGWWLHNDLTDSAIASVYSTPVSTFLQQNAPSTVGHGALGANYAPNFFVFDRYETDDSAAADQATLYNARSWDNFLTAVGQVSKTFNRIPIMLWQIPGSHIPYVGEANPELFNNTPGQYVFSTAPVYFFGGSNLQSDLSNIIAGPGPNTNSAVGNYLLNCTSGASNYHCTAGSNYKQYLLAYQGQPNNFNWGRDNGKLGKAAASGVFAILWGGGNTTNVIKNFSNTDDHGWLAGKIINYYKNPTPVTARRVASHDFNGDGMSDVLWYSTTSGQAVAWLMNGTSLLGGGSPGSVPSPWAIVGQRDFNGDGNADLLWRHGTTGQLVIWFLNGSTVSGGGSPGSVTSDWAIVGTGDFNGDGFGDILCYNSSTGQAVIWLMNGAAVIGGGSPGSVGSPWTVAGTGDFNGDGRTDVLWHNPNTGQVVIWLVSGTSVIGGGSPGSASGWMIAGTGDFNSDGNSDILWYSATTGQTLAWFINGTSLIGGSSVGSAMSPWSIVQTGDYNNDGSSDILWYNASNGQAVVWLLNGTTVIGGGSPGSAMTPWQIQSMNAD